MDERKKGIAAAAGVGGAILTFLLLRKKAVSDPDKAELYGKVTNAQTGGNVAGAVVAITGPGGVYDAVTAGNGNYRIINIEPGTYSGAVTHPDYETHPL